jgi:hypothetical protein
MSTWIRLYTNVVNDPKVQQLPAPLFKFWVNLLCVAGEYEKAGLLPSVGELAWSLHSKKVAGYIKRLVDHGLLENHEDGLHIHNWSGRQYESDSGAPRTRAYRQRIRDLGEVPHRYDRQAVLARDNGLCVYCSAPGTVVDHMIPVLQGGVSDMSNLAAACKKCNSGKAGRRPEEAGFRFANSEAEDRYHGVLTRSHDTAATVSGHVPEQNRTEQNRAEQSSLREPPAPKLVPKDHVDRFFRATKVNEQMAAIIDLWDVPLTRESRGHLGKLLKKNGHGQAVIDAAKLAIGAAGDPVELMEGVLRNGRTKATGGRSVRSGAGTTAADHRPSDGWAEDGV